MKTARVLAFLRAVIVLSLCAVGTHAHANVRLESYRVSPGQQPLPIIRTDETMPAYYRLRAKVIDGISTYGFHAATSMGNNGAPLDTVTGLAPGTYPVVLYWVTYTDAAGTQGAVTGPQETWTLVVTATSVWLSNYTVSNAGLPTIATSEPMPPVFKLRSKVIGVPGYGDGFHAALSWNNNGWTLDASPPPGVWLNQLYWLKYDNTGTVLQTIGPMQDTTLTIQQGRVWLSSYYFDVNQPPSIITNESMPANYRLRALIADGSTSGFQAATTANNNGFVLDRLPSVAGTYNVTLNWEKLRSDGTVTSVGSPTTVPLTIYSGTPPPFLLNGSGHIERVQNYDEEGNETDTSLNGGWHDVYVPGAGALTIYTTGSTPTYGELYDGNWGYIGGSSSGGSGSNFSITRTVQAAGWYHIYVGGFDEGDYQVFGSLSSSTTPPPVPVAMGATNVSSSGFTVTWSAVGTAASYRLDISPSNYFTGSFLVQDQAVTGTSFSVTGLPNATTYFYRVRSVNGAGTSASSATRPVATAPAQVAPSAPTNVTASGFTLSWNSVPGASQYAVYYSTSPTFATSQVYNVTTLAPGGVQTASITGLSTNTAYYYQVAAIGPVGAQSLSPVATLTTPSPRAVRLALEYWQGGDRPNLWTGHYVEVWVDEHDEEIWEEDENGNWYFTGNYEHVDAHYDYIWVDDYYPNGQFGSSWSTTLGRFYRSDPVSGYDPATINRVYLLNNFNLTDSITFRTWAEVPDANCNSFSASLYNPSGTLIAQSSFPASGAWERTFTPGSPAGTYRIDISYFNATNVTPINGTVSYYLPVSVAPLLITQPSPTSQTVAVGSNVTYSVVASGNPNYQWRKNGTSITGEVSASLTLSNVQLTSATGDIYSVIVTNGSGSVTSNGATLIVTSGGGTVTAPSITAQPRDATVTVGQSAILAVQATGTAPLQYQWRKNGTAIPGAINSTLVLGNVAATAAGTYTVVVSNAAGSVTSSGAVLIVGSVDSASVTELKVHTPLP